MDERLKIPLSDRGNYYRGLLVICRKDRSIHEREREWMVRFGQALDFDRRFCEAAIDDLLKNKHISDDPVTFSNKMIVELFIHDAILLALADGKLHDKELAWLKSVASLNGFGDEWLDSQIKGILGKERLPDARYCIASVPL
jgi:hypothetical protein